jgi:guanyl-specific ribonuclease Sa
MIPRMLRRYGWILIAFALFAAWAWRPQAPAPIERPVPIAVPDARDARPAAADAALPADARETLRRIREGGPFPYRQDGGAFQNRERLLPLRPRGWYREYTVDTPGSRDRGARRIVAGGDPPSEFWYTADHYRSFRRIDAEAAVPR